MIVHIDRVKTVQGVIKGLKYQEKDKENPNNPRGEIFRGNPLEVIAWSKNSNSESVKAFSVLVSFEEDRKTLEKKLNRQGRTIDDLVSDIEKFLFAGYKPEEVAYTVIAHDDTDNFHFHIYVANNFAGTGNTLKFWFTPKQLEDFRKYIDLKYGLTSPDFEKKETISRKVLSKKWKSLKHIDREVLREEIHELVLTGIQTGLVKDRKTLIKFLEDQGLKVRRKGKNYISVEIEGIKIRLKGGIYDENFRVEKLLEEAQRGNREDLYREFREIQNRIREYYERKSRDIEERYGEIRKRLNAYNGEAFENVESREFKSLPRKRVLKNADFRNIHRHSDGNHSRNNSSFPIQTLKKTIKEFKAELERLKREIELPQLLSYLGIDFYQSGNYILARVPWREDKNPSFIAHKKGEKWLWYDAGRKEGGSVIDFVIKAFGYSLTGAIEWLKLYEKDIKQTEIKSKSLTQTRKVEVVNVREPEEDFEAFEWLTKVWKLKHLPSNIYIADLKIREKKLRDTYKGFPEVVEVEKEYPNPVLVLKEGDEILFWRDINPVKTQKGWLSSNRPVLVKGKNKNLYVVEGFSDFLTLYQVDPEGSYLILGSVSNVDKAISLLKEYEGFKNILLFLDNDEAGREATEKIRKEVYAYDLSGVYAEKGFKDFKEFYLNATPEKIKDLENRLKELQRPRFNRRPSPGLGL